MLIALLTPVGTLRAAVWTAVRSLGSSIVSTRRGFSGGEFGFSSLGPWPLFAGLLATPAGAAVGGGAFEVGRVFFLFFQKIGDVEESVPFESDVDKRGLHAGKNPGDTALIDGAG